MSLSLFLRSVSDPCLALLLLLRRRVPLCQSPVPAVSANVCTDIVSVCLLLSGIARLLHTSTTAVTSKLLKPLPNRQVLFVYVALLCVSRCRSRSALSLFLCLSVISLSASIAIAVFLLLCPDLALFLCLPLLHSSFGTILSR